jgi:hypothetical protein
MQVFMSEYSFNDAAEVLDTKRLVKQLLEGRQIMTVLAGEQNGNGWKNHPAVKMFEGHESYLYFYLGAIVREMQARGYKWEKNWEVIHDTWERNFASDPAIRPRWADSMDLRKRIVTTHRGRLWEKDPIHYAQYENEGKTFMNYVCCPGKCTYYWPTHVES